MLLINRLINGKASGSKLINHAWVELSQDLVSVQWIISLQILSLLM